MNLKITMRANKAKYKFVKLQINANKNLSSANQEVFCQSQHPIG